MVEMVAAFGHHWPDFWIWVIRESQSVKKKYQMSIKIFMRPGLTVSLSFIRRWEPPYKLTVLLANSEGRMSCTAYSYLMRPYRCWMSCGLSKKTRWRFDPGVSKIGVGEKVTGLDILQKPELKKYSDQIKIFIQH